MKQNAPDAVLIWWEGGMFSIPEEEITKQIHTFQSVTLFLRVTEDPT